MNDITIEQTVYEPISMGMYTATIKDIETCPDRGFGPQLKFTFHLDPFTDRDSGNEYSDGKDMFAWCAMKWSAKSKLYQWASAVLGNIPREDNFRSVDLMNKRVLLSIGHKDRDGMTFDQVIGVMPLKERKCVVNVNAQLPAAEVEPELPC